MARRKKPQVDESEQSPSQKYRGPKLNGISKDNDVDSESDDTSSQPSTMSPSTTVVHKKFGKINCLPPESQHEDPNVDSEGSSQDNEESPMDEESGTLDANDGTELLEVVLAHEQSETGACSVDDVEGMEDNDTETIVVEVEEGMVDEIDHQDTVIVQVVDEELMYSEEDGATIWEVEAVEEVDNEGMEESDDASGQEEVVLMEKEDETAESFETFEDGAVNNVSSSGITEKGEGHDPEVSSCHATRHPSTLDSDVSDREVEDEQSTLRNKLSPDEITQMVLGLNCGSVDVAVERKLCEVNKDKQESALTNQRRESVITRRSSEEIDMDVDMNSRLKGNPIHVYGNPKKNKSPTKTPESSVIRNNCGITTPPRKNVICIDDSPLKSPPSGASSKREEFSCNDLPISSIGGSLSNVDLNSVTQKKEISDKSPFKDGLNSLGIEPIRKESKLTEEESKVANLLRNRSGSSDTTGSDSGSRSPTVRRSTRIRAPPAVKKQTTPKSSSSDSADATKENPSSSTNASSTRSSSNNSMAAEVSMPVKVKSRWRRSSELEMGGMSTSDQDVGTTVPSPSQPPEPPPLPAPVRTLSEKELKAKHEEEQKELSERLKGYEILRENLYLTERYSIFENFASKYSCRICYLDVMMLMLLFYYYRIKSKEAKRMVCDCSLSKEEISRSEMGCGEDCLNRLLMIEW